MKNKYNIFNYSVDYLFVVTPVLIVYSLLLIFSMFIEVGDGC